jgi:DNA invertase Pin-like site-specific DNA recombinase
MIYGYARVSTDGQSVAAQVAALTAAGAVKVYRAVASGAETDRAQLHQVLARLAAGDVLLVTRLDRIARTSEGHARAKARGVHLGRRPKLTPYHKRAALRRRAHGEPLTAIARSSTVSHTTISRLTPSRGLHRRTAGGARAAPGRGPGRSAQADHGACADEGLLACAGGRAARRRRHAAGGVGC